MGYSIKYIKYMEYTGSGLDSNNFIRFLIDFGQIWTFWGKVRPTFFEKVIPI